MSSGGPWPPVSPHAALLSSPSGRKKYEAYKNDISSMPRSATTPSLVDRLRAARTNNDFPPQHQSPEDDEDEETLQLKLAAIEAKLKLKKLQKDKARAATPGRDSSIPGSAHEPPAPQVEVKASPTKRIQATLPKSPSRVLLGIDKGIRGADVSLKRASTVTGNRARINSSTAIADRPTSRSSAFNSARSATSSRTATSSECKKTFSERMTEARERETTIEQCRATTIQNRRRGFVLDQDELDSYRTAAAETRGQGASKSPTRQYFEYSRDQVLTAAAEAHSGTRHLKKSRTMPDLRASPSKDTGQPPRHEGDANLYEDFSGLHLTSRVLPHSFLRRTLPSETFTIYRIPDLLKNVKSPDYELPETVCDYVVFAVIASKSSPMDHKKIPNQRDPDKSTVGTRDWEKQWDDGSHNSRRFMAITLTDLAWTIDLYLFGTALPRYHRLTPGTVVAILNPGIMPPKPGKSDTGAFSLSLSDDSDTVLEIGHARDLGYCKTLKKDGKECGSWVNTAKTDICEWHLNAEIQRTKAGRMGVNTGSNGFGRRENRPMTRNEDRAHKGLLNKDGRRFDRETGAHYYIATTGPKGGGGSGGGGGAAGADDPFIQAVEGELSRPSDRNARLRRHLAAQAKEREIAEKLGSREHGGFGFDSAGAEYLRRKAKQRGEGAKNKGIGDDSLDDGSSKGSAAISKAILSNGSTTKENRKRTAADVRLSPVKKTRFVTAKGIREAGRDSLGAPGHPMAAHGSDSEDDELEIV
ncbi:DNA replication protein [Cladophialophora carrionii]|uniref:DNA replication protein n=1 Tax=Cladophialophora carrionii TaxID=86049 RepID=A0A1C1CFM8_9EURO|nr:DNA replication protein [Cladophialophora carrionii]